MPNEGPMSVQTTREVEEELTRPVVQGLLDLIRIRNEHGAFEGAFTLAPSTDDTITMEWRRDTDWARLEVNLAAPSALITLSTSGGSERIPVTTRTSEVNA